MINKRSLWFLTLFSLILVLSIYYITMPSELLMATNNSSKKTQTVSTKENENAELTALRVESEEKMLDKVSELKKVITSSKSTTKEKNEAFEKMQKLNKQKGLEETIENKIKNEFNLKSFVSIDDINVSVVVDSKQKSASLANKIMRLVQKQFEVQKSISVKFQK
ncbi:MAG: SpoIIIAH-like family protein [Bacilli bacterium]|nr:SpoIIIAH-like family protein [Bacilli bacterium]